MQNTDLIGRWLLAVEMEPCRTADSLPWYELMMSHTVHARENKAMQAHGCPQ